MPRPEAMNASELSSIVVADLVPSTGISELGRHAARPGTTDPARADVSPDVEIAIANLLVRVHARFHVDPETKEVQVTVVDDRGKLIRLIPPESVSEMISAMASYPTVP